MYGIIIFNKRMTQNLIINYQPLVRIKKIKVNLTQRILEKYYRLIHRVTQMKKR